MKLVNVTVRGGNTTEGATGVSFSVLPYEVVVQIPGSREPILSVPVVDNPLLNRQAYSFVVDGFEVDLEVLEVVEDYCEAPVDEEAVECGGISDELAVEEQENQEVLAETLGEPDAEELEPTFEGNHSALEVLLETSSESDVEAGTLSEDIETPSAEIEAVVETTEASVTEESNISIEAETNPATPAEEEDSAFFQRAEGGHEPPVDKAESVVPPVEEQKSAEELKQLLEQTQELLKKYDLNSVEH